MKTVVFTSDNHSWLLRGFFHQWAKYGKLNSLAHDPLEIEVAGYTKPYALPKDVSFYSIGAFSDYPVSKWSDGAIKYFEAIPDDLVLVLLEDYWMIRNVNRQAIFIAYGYMTDHPEVIRFDLAADRVFNHSARYSGSYGALDICEAKGDYALSLQASLFRRKLLLEVLRPGETPWEAELNGSFRLNQMSYRVVGSYQWPMNYFIAMNKGKIDRTGAWMYPARTLKPEDWKELDDLGYTRTPED